MIQFIKLEEVKLLSEEMDEIRARGKKPTDEGFRRSPKWGHLWERLQKPKEREPFKRQRDRTIEGVCKGRLRRTSSSDKVVITQTKPQAKSGGNQDASPRIAGRVDTILGGITGGGDTSNPRRKYAQRSVYALSPMATIDRVPISFFDRELVGLELPQDDPLEISLIIANFVVARMLVNTGSLADILYLQTYDRLGLPWKHLKPVSTPLTGFIRQLVYPTGIAELDLTVGEAPWMVTVRASFTIIDIPDPSCNGLIGRLLLNALGEIVSPLHVKMEFSTSGGVGEIMGDQKMARVCYQLSVLLGMSLKKPSRKKRERES
ncbi:hypothetical protein LIER_25796 [Lithospermum erythrorhizon]|uniref:Uncharacterized protein n=1 Tax=Lithospermum erythrorhizon TaxID=34254 RepID=A0AAV3RA40_LITER